MSDPTPAKPIVDLTALEQFRGLPGEAGPDLVGELLDLYASSSADTLVQLGGAVARGAAADAARHAHSLVGASGTLGAIAMASLARRLEALARDARLDLLPPLIAEAERLLENTMAVLRGTNDEGTGHKA